MVIFRFSVLDGDYGKQRTGRATVLWGRFDHGHCPLLDFGRIWNAACFVAMYRVILDVFHSPFLMA